jgi:hypothetical protein
MNCCITSRVEDTKKHSKVFGGNVDGTEQPAKEQVNLRGALE